MKQIKILLSSVLTLLLFTSNNVSAAVYAKYDGIQAQQPNMNTFKGQVRKGNVFNTTPRRSESRDSGKVKVRNSQQNWGYRVNERGGSNKDVGTWTVDGNLFKPNPNKDVGTWTLDDSNLRNKLGGQEGEAFNPTSKYSISDEPAFIPKPDGALGPDVVTTLEHGPGLHDAVSLGTSNGGMNQTNNFDEMVIELREGNNFHATSSGDPLPFKINDTTGVFTPPKGVQLKFINGEWR